MTMPKTILPRVARATAPYARSTGGMLLLALWLLCACQPINDLDSAAAEFGHAGRGSAPAEAGTAGAPLTTPLAQGGGSGSGPLAASGSAGSRAGSADGGHENGGSSQGGASDAQGGDTTAVGGAFTGDGGDAGEANLALPELPNDLQQSPVLGTISWSTGTYTAGPVVLPTYEIVTPTANYSVSRNSGNIVSVGDKTSGSNLQWVNYTDFRAKRSVGVTTSAQPVMTTTLDQESVTAKHVRLVSKSLTGDFVWAWDFYVTQATLTITQAAAPFGFTYRGTPGGALDAADELTLSSGAVQPASDSFYADLPGPAEWAYLSDTRLGHSLFLIQHRDETLGDRYDSKDADSAAWTFGDGKIAETPARFSLGMVGSASYPAVQARVAFVVEALR